MVSKATCSDLSPRVALLDLKADTNSGRKRRFNSINNNTKMAQSFSSLPSRSLFLQCPSSPSMLLHIPGLIHTNGQINATGVYCNNRNCIGKTKYTLFGNSLSCSHRFNSSCRVKSSEDSERISSGEGIVLDEQTLEQNLQIAIDEENYAQAAKIRDNLRSLHEDGKASVLAANIRFYNSFRKGDLATMQTLWSKGENVCVVHPGVSGISGYDLVMGSWDLVWADYDFPLEIQIKDAQVHVRGDLGYVTCIEFVKTKGGSGWGKQFITNIFERVNGQWYICVHHASPFESR